MLPALTKNSGLMISTIHFGNKTRKARKARKRTPRINGRS